MKLIAQHRSVIRAGETIVLVRWEQLATVSRIIEVRDVGPQSATEAEYVFAYEAVEADMAGLAKRK